MPRKTKTEKTEEKKMISLRVPSNSLNELDTYVRLGMYKDRTTAINDGILKLLAELSHSPNPPQMGEKIEYLENIVKDLNKKVDNDLGALKRDLTGLSNKLELIFQSIDIKD